MPRDQGNIERYRRISKVLANMCKIKQCLHRRGVSGSAYGQMDMNAWSTNMLH